MVIAAISHGTHYGAQQHYARGEKPCPRCREAHNAEQRQRRAARKEPDDLTDPETRLRWDGVPFLIYDFLRAWGDPTTLEGLRLRLPRPVAANHLNREVWRLVKRGLLEALPANPLTGCPARFRVKGTA